MSGGIIDMLGSVVFLSAVVLTGVVFFPINRMYTHGRINLAGMMVRYGLAVWLVWVVAWPLALWLSGDPRATIVEITLKFALAAAVGIPAIELPLYYRYKVEMEAKGLPGLYTPPSPGMKVRWYHVLGGCVFLIVVALWSLWQAPS